MILSNSGSVTAKISRYLIILLIFTGILSAGSLLLMESNRFDAELINVSGSWRMQAYRLLYTMENEPENIRDGLLQYHMSLHSNSLYHLKNQWITPENVLQSYQQLTLRWEEMAKLVVAGDQQGYRNNLADYVGQVDNFVFSLQQFEEQKLRWFFYLMIFVMSLMIAIITYVIFYVKGRFATALRNQQQLLIMEERAVIARELHDSLAQVLAFLKIQFSLLKNQLRNPNSQQKSLVIVEESEQALIDGNRQLRELLSTFRLTIAEADLKIALEQILKNLQSNTEMQLTLDCSLPSQFFSPQQLVHILQIVREAVLNAIKHSEGSRVDVIAHLNHQGKSEILVVDDGKGIESTKEPEGHYGLNIMKERAVQLNATITLQKVPNKGGTQVSILLP